MRARLSVRHVYDLPHAALACGLGKNRRSFYRTFCQRIAEVDAVNTRHRAADIFDPQHVTGHDFRAQSASILFREHGFSAVSLSEIIKATGVTYGAFYHHFESKEDLIAKSIEETSAKALESMRERAARGERKAQYVDGYLTEQHRDDRGNGCMMAGLADEIARQPAAQPAFTHHVEGMLKGFTESRVMTRKKNTCRDAIHTLSSIVGALILARAVDDPELSKEILCETRAALD